YGAAYKHEKGGIYSWMASSVGPKYAFIGTFMWYASYLVWQVNVSTTIWVPLSNAIFGRDLTQTMTYFGMSPTKWLGILAALWVLLVTFVSTKGLDKIKQITSVGGLAIMLLNVVLLVGGLIVLALHGGQFAQPINDGLRTFAVSPNPAYQSPLSIISFLTYAIFAYGGIEAVGGLVDQTKNAEKTFPVGVTISAIVISVGYSLGIFLMGIFINWEAILSLPAVNTANVTYIVMQNLGYTLAIGFGLAEATSLAIGMWVARLVGLSMFLALTGAFFTLIYSPLKQLIEGTPAGIWPKRFTETKNNMPAYAMRFQATLVIILILVVSFGGDNASALFNKLVTMTNVAMTIPYMFLAIAFPFFKKKEHIVKPFAIYKSYGVSLVASIIVTITIGFANIFSIIEPGLAKGYWIDTLFAGGGPVIFAIVALLLYHNYESKQNS
ncbi:MAG: glutamate/gamma-aminobutyrate family transporter YjeM, partial [Niameybacter sp.]